MQEHSVNEMHIFNSISKVVIVCSAVLCITTGFDIILAKLIGSGLHQAFYKWVHLKLKYE